MNGIDQLCPNCGLCCDSTLFADVELRRSDDPERLQQLGFTLFKKSRLKTAFAQPCVCFDGKLCRIYAERPKRCRLFECGLLKRLQAGEMTAETALKKIGEAKRQAEEVRELLRSLGQTDEGMSLANRYKEAMSAPMDMTKDEETERRGELMMAVGDLMQRLEKDFLR
jgi:Fe-S-cluster containining protein